MKLPIILAAALLGLLSVGAAEAQTHDQISKQINTLIVPNTRGQITAGALQGILNALNDNSLSSASPIFTGVATIPTLNLTSSGSTGDVSTMSVTAGGASKPLASWMAGFAPLANPIFAGAVSAPKLTITGSGTTGDLSAASVTPSGSAAAGTLASLFYSPVYGGTVSAQGTMVSGAQIPSYLSGLKPTVGMGVNLSGLPFTSALMPPPSPIGDPTLPLAGVYSNIIGNNGHASTRAGNVNAYRAAFLGQATAYANSPDLYGMDLQVNHDFTAPADISVIGLEIDMAKNGSRDCNSVGGPIYCAGMMITSSTDGSSSWGPAYLAEGAPYSFHYGFATNGAGVKDADFFSASTATTSLVIGGTHTTGINISGTITGQQIAGIKWGVDAVGNVSGASGTFPVLVSTGKTQIAGGAPASATAACNQGEIRINSDSYIYFCTQPNTWVRAQGASF